MPEGFVSRKAKEAQLYPKSSGESANNENQIITPFKWKNNADKTEVIVSLKDKYVFNISDLTTLLSSSAITSLLYRPPIGIPVFWFSSVPDWALAFDDGSGPYAWEDYPEFDNDDFKAMLTIWANAGWMPAYNSISFYVPDLRGMHGHIAGVSGLKRMSDGNYFNGGAIGSYEEDAMQRITGNIRYTGTSTNVQFLSDSRAIEALGALSISSWRTTNSIGNGSTVDSYPNGIGFNSANSPGARTKAKTTPAGYAKRLIVRFE